MFTSNQNHSYSLGSYSLFPPSPISLPPFLLSPLSTVHTQLRSRTAELLQALELKQKECSKLQSETEATQRKLIEQVTKSVATQKELQAKLAGEC